MSSRTAIRIAAVALVLLVAGAAAVVYAATTPPPPLTGTWDFKVVLKKPATGTITFNDPTSGAFTGTGLDDVGGPFTLDGTFSQNGRLFEGTMNVHTSDEITLTYTGKCNAKGTKMKWKAVMTAGPDVGHKVKIRLHPSP